ncbi:LytR/AlgR family response regulator transcription factor [Gilvimarinus xylanilyticus]|uniref:LytTR family DNA-binding domain-containing protein n=1 Tax=Gilvimarinus xylanilyticus TaxID=2944139 RepID=A0A9X2I3E9_9GAMM|nr:LytTR family DNA-binding domain-containing protein [Gilvimarinus xylanilyticus]MCP8899286.1 LytTR family DNA-binding domain-containing protein [Gilvimarinus xylanilyticus]
MRIAIVDDSRLARLELKQQLVDITDPHTILEAASVAEAVDLLAREAVDLLLLDIDLPDGTGFDVLQQVSNVPAVIFVTAFDEFAVRSFEVNALDYLLKPVRQERLRAALSKVQNAPEARPLSTHQRIFIKDGERCFFVSLAEVFAFEAMGNYTKVHLASASPCVYRPISAIAERLAEDQFFRASRSWVINTAYITTIDPAVSGGFAVTLGNGLEVAISKRQAAQFRRLWSL